MEPARTNKLAPVLISITAAINRSSDTSLSCLSLEIAESYGALTLEPLSLNNYDYVQCHMSSSEQSCFTRCYRKLNGNEETFIGTGVYKGISYFCWRCFTPRPSPDIFLCVIDAHPHWKKYELLYFRRIPIPIEVKPSRVSEHLSVKPVVILCSEPDKAGVTTVTSRSLCAPSGGNG